MKGQTIGPVCPDVETGRVQGERPSALQVIVSRPSERLRIGKESHYSMNSEKKEKGKTEKKQI
jgi:hypothetical protein